MNLTSGASAVKVTAPPVTDAGAAAAGTAAAGAGRAAWVGSLAGPGRSPAGEIKLDHTNTDPATNSASAANAASHAIRDEGTRAGSPGSNQAADRPEPGLFFCVCLL